MKYTYVHVAVMGLREVCFLKIFIFPLGPFPIYCPSQGLNGARPRNYYSSPIMVLVATYNNLSVVYICL